MSRRTDRVAHLIQREIGNVILKELTDVRIGFVTISRVEVTTDMAFAKVHVSIMGSDKEKRDSMAGLAHSASYLRTHLAKVMKMRTVPAPAVRGGQESGTRVPHQRDPERDQAQGQARPR